MCLIPAYFSLLVKIRDRSRDALSLTIGADIHASRQVPHIGLGNAYARGGTWTDNADDIDILSGDLPDTLPQRDTLLLRDAHPFYPQIHHLADAPGRLFALFSPGVKPPGIFRPARRAARDTQPHQVKRKAPGMLRPIVVPGGQLRLISRAAGDGEAAFYHLEVEIDAHVFPVLLDRFHELVKRGVGRTRHRHDQAQPALPVTAQAVALGVLLVQPNRIQHGVGLLRVIGSPHGTVLGTWEVRIALDRHYRPGRTGPEPEYLVDLLAVDGDSQGPAEVSVMEPLGNLRVLIVGHVELYDQITTVIARVQRHLVLAALLVL